ncbi:MAG: hypothetical protein RIQ60_2199 [Pseudomonadota bacterium]
MDAQRTPAVTHDLSALAWVQEELRKTLESAHKALRRYLREAESTNFGDLDEVEPTILRHARQQLHAGVGALELVNLPEGALLMRASEALVQRFVAKPTRVDTPGVEAVESASFALLDYLARRIGGKPTDAVGLFAQLHGLLERTGADRVHPADLWPIDWRWRPIAQVVKIDALAATAPTLAEFERLLLGWVKQNRPDIARALRNTCAGLAQRPATSEETILWRLAAGFFDGITVGGLTHDNYVKRTASRLMQHLRNLVKTPGESAVAERLAQDLLFFCACVPASSQRTPFLAAVREAYDLGPTPPLDYNQTHYGRYDPAWIAQARKRVESAKQAWSGVAGDEPHRITQLIENFTLVGDSVRRLYGRGERLAQALVAAAEQTTQRGRLDSAELAMEVATSLLYLEASLEERDFDQPGQDAQIERLAERLDRVCSGQHAEPLEPWIEQLYRRVSDRQTMSSVVQELRASLSEVERQIDQFFRNPRESGLLVPVPVQLKGMHGVLGLLGIDQACLAIDRMVDDVDNLVHDQLDSLGASALPAFHRLAGNLGALGFLIDTLAVQPGMASNLFVFDKASGIIAPVMGRNVMAPDLVERVQAIADAVRREQMPLHALSAELDALSRNKQISKQPALAASLSSAQDAIDAAGAAGAGQHTEEAVREHIAQAMDDFVATATNPVGLDPMGTPLISRPMDLAPAPAEPTGLEGDTEMRDIFLEESREVLGEAQIALAELARTPADISQITTVRRAFHTLKGSARMVGLASVAEAAWAYEQLYNRWLAEQTPASGELRLITGDALHYLGAWIDAIAQHDDDAFLPDPLVAAADTLRLAGELMRVPAPQRLAAAPTATPHAPHVAPALPALVLPIAEDPIADGTVDFEVPLDEPRAGVFEQLQATQPIELGQAEPQPFWDRTAPVDLQLGGDSGADVDLLLDLGDGADTAPPALALDFGLGARAPSPPSSGVPSRAADAPPPNAADAPLLPPVPGEEAVLGDAPARAGDWSSDDDLAMLSDLMPELTELEGMAEQTPPAAVPDIAISGMDVFNEAIEPVPAPAQLATAAPAPDGSLPPEPAAVGDLSALDLEIVELTAGDHPPVSREDIDLTLLDLNLGDTPLPTVTFGVDADKRAPWQPSGSGEPLFTPAAFAPTGDQPVAGASTGPDDAARGALPADDGLIDLPEFDLSAPAVDLPEFPAAPIVPDFDLLSEDSAGSDDRLPTADVVEDVDAAAPGAPAALEATSPSTPTESSTSSAPDQPPVGTGATVVSLDRARNQDEYRHIGHLRLKIPLFNIYLNEADELSRRLVTELAEWALELHRPVGDSATALAHSLAGNSATVGFEALSRLARELEHALQRSDEIGHGQPADADLFSSAAEEIRHLLHQFAAGFLHDAPPQLMQSLTDWQHQADQLLLARLARNSIQDSLIGPTTLSPTLQPADQAAFDPANLPTEVADTGWQPEADSPLPPPMGAVSDLDALNRLLNAPQSFGNPATPAPPVDEGFAPSSVDMADPIASDAGDSSQSLTLDVAPPQVPVLQDAGEVADLDVDLGEFDDLPAAADAAAQASPPPLAPPSGGLSDSLSDGVADKPPARPAQRVVTLADLGLPVPDVVVPLTDDEAAAHFEDFASSFSASQTGVPTDTSNWTTDISFDLPPAAAPGAPQRPLALDDARPNELQFPTIPGEIELVVDGQAQAQPEKPTGLDLQLDLASTQALDIVRPSASDTGSTDIALDLDDERPVAGEADLGLDIDLFEAPQEEPYSEPLTQMVDLSQEGVAAARPALPSGLSSADLGDSLDALDFDLFPVFEEEALDLLPVLTQQMQAWRNYPTDSGPGTACMRTLHTFKGGARLAGAMKLGELAHNMETAIEHLLGADTVDPATLAKLQPEADRLVAAFEALRTRFNTPRNTSLSAFGGLSGTVPLAGDTRGGTLASRSIPFADSTQQPPKGITLEPLSPSMPMPLDDDDASAEVPLVVEPAIAVAWRASQLTTLDAAQAAAAKAASASGEPPQVQWASLLQPPSQHSPQAGGQNISTLPVRVRPQLLDRLVNLAGEVSITRARLESEVGQIRGSLIDLGDNLDRLNQQLRDVALQADTQLESRMEAARAMSQAFDPLELDRYTRLQELTRMMAESVNDVATVRNTLQRTLQTTEDELAMQGRLTRELQGDLLRTRMLEFDSLSERLQRVVRLAAAETGKQARLDISGGSIEVDRGVLDRMTPAFEHLLRNCVGHGIESPDLRSRLGKDPSGSIAITVHQEGNEVSVEVRDDGRGLDLDRIRERARHMGLLGGETRPTDAALAQLIFTPGLSTADQVTELAGRGVGMDVVRSDVQALGGRIEIQTQAGRGTRFKLVLPLTTVVTQVVLLRAGAVTIAVPSHLVELVQRASSASLQQAYASGSYLYGGMSVPFYWLGALLESSGSGAIGGRTRPVIIVRSAQQRVALHVDEVQGNQEVVVKNLGAQLSRLPGLAGLTLLASGGVALIYNPVALATVYGNLAQDHTRIALAGPTVGEPVNVAPEVAPPAPLVLVVDDSLTVRRVTKRLLEREGWRVALAKDGMEALEVLGGERPVLVLSDIEMPRMDGFDLLRNIRADAKLGELPVIMITSRIAEKHRDHAMELGANHYLGKPYAEEELMALVRSYSRQRVAAPATIT